MVVAALVDAAPPQVLRGRSPAVAPAVRSAAATVVGAVVPLSAGSARTTGPSGTSRAARSATRAAGATGSAIIAGTAPITPRWALWRATGPLLGTARPTSAVTGTAGTASWPAGAGAAWPLTPLEPARCGTGLGCRGTCADGQTGNSYGNSNH